MILLSIDQNQLLRFVRVRRGARGVELLQFELQRPLCDDPLPGLQPFQDGNLPAVLVTKFYFSPLKLFAREQNIDDLFTFVVEHGFPRDHHRFERLTRVEPHVCLHPDTQNPAAIRDGKNDVSGPLLFFYDLADVDKSAVTFVAGERYSREARLTGRPDLRQVALEDRRFDPDSVEVCDLQNRLAWRDPLADALADPGDQAADRRAHRISSIDAANNGVRLRYFTGGFERLDAGLSSFRRGLRGFQLGFSRLQLPLRKSLLLVEPPRPFGFAARQVETRDGRVHFPCGGPPLGLDPGGLDPGLRLNSVHLCLFGRCGRLLQSGDELSLSDTLPNSRNIPA